MTKYMIWILILLIIDLCIVLGGWLFEKKRYEELKEKNKHQYAEPFWKSLKDNRAVPINVTQRIHASEVFHNHDEAAVLIKKQLAGLLGEIAINYAEIIAEQDIREMEYVVKARIYIADLSQNNSKELFPEKKHE